MSSVAAEKKPEVQDPDALVPIEESFLKVGSEVKFPIYQVTNGSEGYILLVNRNQRFTERLKSSIQSASDSNLFTKRRYVLDYDEYVESRVAEILANEAVPLGQRSTILYGRATMVMKNLFEGDIKRESLEKAAGYAEHLSRFLDSNPKALRSMMAMTVKDYYTFTHSLHVSVFGLSLFLRALADTSPYSSDEVAMGMLFHDIGKTRVPSAILQKKGPLDPSEWHAIKQHPLHGYKILEKNGLLRPAISEIVLCHHEKLNGKGYPRGLKGEEVPALAQVASIADMFDAITTNRSYRKALTPFQALEEIKKDNVGNRFFQQELFEAFILMVAE